jgi:hypothetical protein
MGHTLLPTSSVSVSCS